MRVLLRAIGIALTTAIVGGVLAAYCADVATRVNGVSDFEGGRGMFIGFVLLPAAVVVSLIVGTIAAVAGTVEGRGAYLVRQSRAVTTVALAIGGISILSSLFASQPPLIDGLAAELQVELRLPRGAPVPDVAGQDLQVSLYAPSAENQYVTLDPDDLEERDGRTIVRGRATLRAKYPGRTLTVVESRALGVAFELPVPAQPTAANATWSEWRRPSRGPNGAEVPANSYEVRYRIVAEER